MNATARTTDARRIGSKAAFTATVRRTTSAVRVYEFLQETHREVFAGRDEELLTVAFTRHHEGVELLVPANFAGGPVQIEVPDAARWRDAELLLANLEQPAAIGTRVELQPWEARVHRRA